MHFTHLPLAAAQVTDDIAAAGTGDSAAKRRLANFEQYTAINKYVGSTNYYLIMHIT